MIDISIAQRADRDGNVWFEVDPDQLYPMMAKHLAEVKRTGSTPQGSNVLQSYFGALMALPDDVFECALLPVADVAQEQWKARNDALELCRLWFTEVLHGTVGGPMGVHLTPANDQYKLAPDLGAINRANKFLGIEKGGE